MPEITVTDPFKKKVLEQAKKMVKENIFEQPFEDNEKTFEGLNIYIDNKPSSTLFSFDFPEDFDLGNGKRIYVGNN